MARLRIQTDIRWAVWERDDFRCRHCGSRQRLTIDHVIPIANGGTNDPDNFQTLCASCNCTKWTRPNARPNPRVLIPVRRAAERAVVLAQARDDTIRAAHTGGATIRAVAAAASLSSARVHQIVQVVPTSQGVKMRSTTVESEMLAKLAVLVALVCSIGVATSQATAATNSGVPASNAMFCAKSWATVENGSGGSFNSIAECASSRDVYAPTLTIDPTAVVAFQPFLVVGAGLHASTAATLSFAVTGLSPYFSLDGLTNADGSFYAIIRFSGCGTAYPYDLTLTVTDSFGVHASAQMTLC